MAPAAEAAQPIVAPFPATAEESTFAVRDAGTNALPTLLGRDSVNPPASPWDVNPDVVELRAAAASREPGIECIVEIADEVTADSPVSDAPVFATVRTGRDAHRLGRIAQRVAERYPNARACR
jgi:hypothetical protein